MCLSKNLAETYINNRSKSTSNKRENTPKTTAPVLGRLIRGKAISTMPLLTSMTVTIEASK